MKYKKGILYETRRIYYDDIYFYKDQGHIGVKKWQFNIFNVNQC